MKAMLLEVERLAENFSFRCGSENSKLDCFIQRQFGFRTCAVGDDFARLDIERHLPLAVRHLLCSRSLCIERPEGVHLEEIMQKRSKRIGRSGLQLTIEIACSR